MHVIPSVRVDQDPALVVPTASTTPIYSLSELLAILQPVPLNFWIPSPLPPWRPLLWGCQGSPCQSQKERLKKTQQICQPFMCFILFPYISPLISFNFPPHAAAWSFVLTQLLSARQWRAMLPLPWQQDCPGSLFDLKNQRLLVCNEPIGKTALSKSHEQIEV